MESKTTIIIAEDKKIFRDIIVHELASHGIATIAQASNGEELLRCLVDKKPHVVLLDLDMPVMDGKEALLRIRVKHPKIKVIILSTHFELALVEYFASIGAKGYIPKDALAGNIQVLADAICDVKKGGVFFYNQPGADFKFSRTQIRLIPSMCEGKTNREMAEELCIHVRSVEKLKQKIYARANSHNAAGFLKFALSRGLNFLGTKKPG